MPVLAMSAVAIVAATGTCVASAIHVSFLKRIPGIVWFIKKQYTRY